MPNYLPKDIDISFCDIPFLKQSPLFLREPQAAGTYSSTLGQLVTKL